MELTKKRITVWNTYHSLLLDLERAGYLRRPIIPSNCQHNGHMYYILLNDLETRTRLIKFLKDRDILSVYHFLLLHSSPAGQKFGRTASTMKITNSISDRILRFPLFYDIKPAEVKKVVNSITEFFSTKK